MSNESHGRPKRLAALSAAAALAAMGLVAGPSWAEDESESPSPSPSESASETASETPTDASESPSAAPVDAGHNPAFEAPETVDTYFGQSVQVRMNADGEPNSNLTNFRWAVSQVNAESTNNLDVAIPAPMDEVPLFRSLTGHGNSATEVEGGVIYEFPAVNGITTKRTLNLWPKDRDLKVNVTSKFTLDGQEVKAGDIIGKHGLVTADYTIHNMTVEERDVKYTDIAGEEASEKASSSLGFVGISKAFIPQAWAQFDAGHGGIFGADGRGNYQTQWISLAFLPFAENGEAHFGWSAVVPDDQKAFIPKMVIEVSPLFVPPHEPGEEEEEAAAESDNGVPKPDLDPATSMIHAGVEDLIDGISGIIDLLPEEEPCDPAKELCTLPEKLGALKTGLTTASKALGDLDKAITDALAGAPAPISPETVQGYIDQIDKAIADIDTSIAAIDDELEAAPGGPNEPQAPGANCTSNPPADYCVVLENAKDDLTESKRQLQAVKAALVQIQEGGGANVSSAVLEELQTKIQTAKKSVDTALASLTTLLGTISSAQDLASKAASGKSQISAGIGAAGEEVQAYIANVVAVAQAAAAEGKTAAGEAAKAANTVKAQIAGLKERLAESPLPYGGGMNTVYAPAGNEEAVTNQALGLVPEMGRVDEGNGVQHTTKLFGAYQFILDPADTNKPNTIWRILLALILVGGAGFLGARVAGSRA